MAEDYRNDVQNRGKENPENNIVRNSEKKHDIIFWGNNVLY